MIQLKNSAIREKLRILFQDCYGAGYQKGGDECSLTGIVKMGKLGKYKYFYQKAINLLMIHPLILKVEGMCPKCKAPFHYKGEIEEWGCWSCGFKPSQSKQGSSRK